MLADLLARFRRPDDAAPLPPEDARLALTALMVRAARADGDFDAHERAEILAVLADRYALVGAGAEALLAEAETAEAEAPDTFRFASLIRRTIPHEDRAAVLEALWRVALSDGGRDPEEDALLRQVSALIGVTDQDSARARRRAEDR